MSKGVRERVEGKKEGTQVMQESIKKGEVKFFLQGERMKGSYALVKTHGFAGKNAWLFIKHKDEYDEKDFDAKAEKYDTSVVSGKTLTEIAKQ